MTPPRSVGSAVIGSPPLGLTEIKSFGGIRLTLRTELPFDEVLARFRAQVGNASVPEIVRLATEFSRRAYLRQRNRGALPRQERLHAVRGD